MSISDDESTKKFYADLELTRSQNSKALADIEKMRIENNKTIIETRKISKELKWYEMTLIVAITLAVVAIVKLFL